MKHLAMLSFIATLCFSLGATPPAMAQGRRGGGGGGGGQGGGLRSGAGQPDEANTILLLSTFLDLSDAQTQMVRVIFDNALVTGKPLAAEIDTGNKALFEAAKAGQSDDQIATLAEQQGGRESKMQVLQAQTFAKVFAILNSSQKSQADAFIYGSVGRFLESPQPPALPGLPPGIGAVFNPAALPPPGALGAPNPATPPSSR